MRTGLRSTPRSFPCNGRLLNAENHNWPKCREYSTVDCLAPNINQNHLQTNYVIVSSSWKRDNKYEGLKARRGVVSGL